MTQALVTGASSGIGAEFARQLAARGYTVILVARRREKLQELADALPVSSAAGHTLLPVDLATPEGQEEVAHCIASTSDLSLLVNNAGFATTQKFYRVDPARSLEMSALHVTALVRLCQAALPGMLAQHRGGIINVSSLMAFIPLPGSVMYSSTKSFQLAFSQSLNAETRKQGVTVQALCPGFTHTELHSTPEFDRHGPPRLPRLLWSTPPQVVSASLRALERAQAVCIPGWINRLVAGFVSTPGLRQLAQAVVYRYRS